ncbi:MAG: ZIP family metal transporter [Candidatus Micrarchaeia archaeon]
MDVFFWIFGILLLNTIIGGVGILSLLVAKKDLQRIAFFLMAFAAGTLLGGAFLHLLIHSLEEVSADVVFISTLFGFLIFFIFENYLHFHRCVECKIHPYTYLILVGDAIHNIFDGIVVAVTFLISIPLGIATSIAILTHELPQELGIFGVMVHSGQDKKKSILYSVLAQSTSIIGGILGYAFSFSLEEYIPSLLPFVAGGFIYIASADLIPEIHKTEKWQKIEGILALLFGLVFMWIMKGV